MVYGGPYMAGIGTVLMLLLFAGNLDYIKPTRVIRIICLLYMVIMHCNDFG